jgi:hypothetical protein
MTDRSPWLQRRVSWEGGNKRGGERETSVGLSTHGLDDDMGPMMLGRLTRAFIHPAAIRHCKRTADA